MFAVTWWKRKSVSTNFDEIETVSLLPKQCLRNTHLAAIAALLNMVSVGMISSYSAPATMDMKRPGSRFVDITPSQITWIASLHGITSLIGSPVSGYISQILGRKAVLIYISGPYLASWLIIAYAPSIGWIYVGRLLSGFCSGIVMVTVPAYVVEIATVETRGLLTSGVQLSFTIGVLLTMSFGVILRWSWLAVTGGFIVTSSALLMFFMPESPSWLISKGKMEESLQGIQFLRGRKVDKLKEYQEMLDNVAIQSHTKMTFGEFKEPHLYKPLILIIGLMFFQQFSGINALMSYTVEIFEDAESSLDPSIAAATVAGVQVISTLISGLLVDKVGRKVLYLISGTFVTFGLSILGVYGIVLEKYALDSETYGWIPLFGFIVFIAAFALGYGPIPFVMTPELVPIQNRGAVLAIASVCNSFFMFVVTKTFDDMRIFLSDYGIYWAYGGFSLIGCVFCIICLPETKGKLINEIQMAFQKKH